MDANVIIDGLPFDTAIDHPAKEMKPLPPGKKFHIFFSYKDVLRDKLWVKNVIGKLETEYGYICCDHERDFMPGTKIMDSIKNGVNNSEKVVVVFSKEAIDSQFVLLEAAMAYRLNLEKGNNLLIPVLLDGCYVPEEYKLLTYIDAREGVEETTWWPKLLKSIESKEKTSWSLFDVEKKSVAATFAVSQLCSIDTKYSCLRRSIQAISKYVPEELRSNNVEVPVDLIRAACKDLLQSPRVVCRQKYCCLATSGFEFWKRGCFVLYIGLVAFMLVCFLAPSPPVEGKAGCISLTSGLFVLVIAITVCFPCAIKQFYLKNPESVRYNIVEHNRNLSKYGVMVTVVPRFMWATASIIFYKCRFQLCKEYVIRHLMKEDNTFTMKHRNIPDSGQMVATIDALPPNAGDGDISPCAEQSIQNVNTLDPVKKKDAEYDTDVSDDKQTEYIYYENKALDLLMSCTPEYFALAYANKLKNQKVDRHGLDILCLCQYLEKANKDFSDKVKTAKYRKREIDHEEMHEDENSKHLKNISLF